MNEKVSDLRREVDRLQAVAAEDELSRLRAALAERGAALASHASALREERLRSMQLQRTLDEELQAHNGATKALSPIMPEELARFGVVGLADLGEAKALHSVDRALQCLAMLMAWRSDVRLAVFGLWLICHFLYMANLLYEHFVK